MLIILYIVFSKKSLLLFHFKMPFLVVKSFPVNRALHLNMYFRIIKKLLACYTSTPVEGYPPFESGRAIKCNRLKGD